MTERGGAALGGERPTHSGAYQRPVAGSPPPRVGPRPAGPPAAAGGPPAAPAGGAAPPLLGDRRLRSLAGERATGGRVSRGALPLTGGGGRVGERPVGVSKRLPRTAGA